MEDSGEGFPYQRSMAQREEEPMTLEGLPYEVGLRICGFLSAADLLHLALASSHTHALATDHSYASHPPAPPPSVWYLIFVNLFCFSSI
jgi:hypothetical protein